MGAEAAVTKSYTVFGGEVCGDQSGVESFHREINHADGVLGVAEDPVDRHAVDCFKSLYEVGADSSFMGMPGILIQAGEHLRRPGQCCRTEDVGGAALVAGGT
ncbi:hypothetical protein StoSoilB13_13710 [Arthrobacter sp. StoSoilB13]|nr:hypothetical protein StoSoilB13_13710 [Arthrobacter sp. StoSoilB13]